MQPLRRINNYKVIGPDTHVCIYCGMNAEVMDHALPYSLRDLPIARERILVPACSECNGLLSNSLQSTLGDRVKEAKKRLRKKYTKLMKMPYWSMQEVMELSGRLKDEVLISLQAKQVMENRLAFDVFLWQELGCPSSLLP